MPFGNDGYFAPRFDETVMLPEKFPDHPLGSVSLDRIPDFTADGDPQFGDGIGSCQPENKKMGRVNLPPHLTDSNKILSPT